MVVLARARIHTPRPSLLWTVVNAGVLPDGPRRMDPGSSPGRHHLCCNRGAQNHAFIAAQIERALNLLALPVEIRRQQNFAAKTDRTRSDRCGLGAEVEGDDDHAAV